MSSAQYKYLKILNENALRKIIISNPRKKNSLNLVAYQEIIGMYCADYAKKVFRLHRYVFRCSRGS